jgi:hypothetical protein
MIHDVTLCFSSSVMIRKSGILAEVIRKAYTVSKENHECSKRPICPRKLDFLFSLILNCSCLIDMEAALMKNHETSQCSVPSHVFDRNLGIFYYGVKGVLSSLRLKIGLE